MQSALMLLPGLRRKWQLALWPQFMHKSNPSYWEKIYAIFLSPLQMGNV